MISFRYCYMVSLHSLAFLELTVKTRLVKDLPVSASQVLGLKAAAAPLPGVCPVFVLILEI